jgi:hypothetical protein
MKKLLLLLTHLAALGIGFALGIYALPILIAPVAPTAATTVIVWCESFGQFITAARYR